MVCSLFEFQIVSRRVGKVLLEAFCEGLKAIPVTPHASVLDNLDAVRQGVTHLPLQARLFLDAWLDDVAKVI